MECMLCLHTMCTVYSTHNAVQYCIHHTHICTVQNALIADFCLYCLELVVQAQEDNVVQVENVARQQVHSRTSSQGTLTPPAAQDGDHEQLSSAGKKKEEDGSSGGGDSTGDEDQGEVSGALHTAGTCLC